jgi:hypothetical protein
MFKHAKGFRGNKPPGLRRKGTEESYVDSKNSLESLMSESEAQKHIEKNFPKRKSKRPKHERLQRESAVKATQQTKKEVAAARRAEARKGLYDVIAGAATDEARKAARKRARKREREQFLQRHAQMSLNREAEEARARRKAKAHAQGV